MPCTIECEQYDLGGSGVAYSVSTGSNLGGKYRTDAVSLYRSSDYGGAAGYCIGSTWPGNWFGYTTTICESAQYVIAVRARIASSSSSASTVFHFNWLGANNVSGHMTLPNSTTAWQTIYATTPTTLWAGTGALQLVIDSGDATYGAGFFDYVTIYKVPPTPSAGSGSFTISSSSLSSDTTAAAGQANANVIQNAINSLGSGGGTVTLPAGTYYLCQANPLEARAYMGGGPAPPPAVALVSSQPVDNLIRTDSYWVGFQFTVGGSSLVVSNLGRWVVSGDGGSHTVELFDSNGNQLTTSAGPGNYAYVTVGTSGQPTNQFVYAAFAKNATFTLLANTTYALMSSEGGDPWYDMFDNQIAVNGVVTSPWAVYASAMPGAYTVAAYGGGKSYVPVSLQFNGQPAQPSDNYAVLVCTNNITIQGTSPGTTLVACNRDTTIFYLGSGYQGTSPPAAPPNSRAVTNVTLQNLTFQGNPTIDWAGFYCPTGIVWADSLPNWFDPLGSLVVFGGAWNPTLQLTNYSQNLAVQNCTFYNPSDIGLNLLWDTDVLVTNCNFSYFNGINHSQSANFGAWCGVQAFAPWVQDVALFNNGFNGNASMQLSTDYTADGLVWLSTGGQWIASGNSITNYDLEAVHFDAGPYTVVSNSYNTLSANNSACALNTDQNSTIASISSSASINSTYCFVGNNVVGGTEGVQDPGQASISPYNLIISANQVNLTTSPEFPDSTGQRTMAHLIACEGVTVTGNTITNVNRAIAFQNYTTSNLAGQVTTFLVLCNDFVNVDHSSFFVQDSGNKMTNALFQANRLGHGYEHHFEMGCPASNAPTNTIIGNQFWPIVLGQPGVSGASVDNGLSGSVGCEFTVGTTALNVTHIGRWVLSGNTQTHTLQFFTSSYVPCSGWSATVPTAGQQSGQYSYGAFQSGGTFTGPITLSSSTTYIITSTESNSTSLFSKRKWLSCKLSVANHLLQSTGIQAGGRAKSVNRS
ncbi:MAG: hypothetical protein KGS61_10425, partial [Verrucomicrobia bacterium]|nr:hypothetical protein [Verrucomicrobiota bacterium]